MSDDNTTTDATDAPPPPVKRCPKCTRTLTRAATATAPKPKRVAPNKGKPMSAETTETP